MADFTHIPEPQSRNDREREGGLYGVAIFELDSLEIAV